jgi:lipopolysaccharide/colanic/teichoic acid biosynthesis glycosyltransferase
VQRAERIVVGRQEAGSRKFSCARALDLSVTIFLLLFALPLMLVTAAFIWLEDGGSIFFIQNRVGRDGRIFPCLKFRSMRENAEERWLALLQTCPQAQSEWALNRKLKRDPRVTSVGRFIRSRSLDELPQLLNVLVGQMSLVGPRPIMMDEIGLYGARLSTYCSVRPGITGLWQIKGRADASFRTRIAMDMVYVRSRRVWRDVGILIATIPAVLLGRGSY